MIIWLYIQCAHETDTNRQTRTGTNRGVMEPVNENEPQEPEPKFLWEPNRKS